MNKQEDRIPGDWGIWQWLALGVLGIVLALAIALAAGRLASQPVGLAGEPVSAASAMEPASTTPAGSRGDGRKTGSPGKAAKPDVVPVSPEVPAGTPIEVPQPDTAPLPASPPVASPPVASPPANVQSDSGDSGGEAEHEAGGDD